VNNLAEVENMTLEMALCAVVTTYSSESGDDIGYWHRQLLYNEMSIDALKRLLGFRASLESAEGIYIYTICLFMTRETCHNGIWYSKNAEKFIAIYGEITNVKSALDDLPAKIPEIYNFFEGDERAQYAVQRAAEHHHIHSTLVSRRPD
jgi:hypothetical protein